MHASAEVTYLPNNLQPSVQKWIRFLQKVQALLKMKLPHLVLLLINRKQYYIRDGIVGQSPAVMYGCPSPFCSLNYIIIVFITISLALGPRSRNYIYIIMYYIMIEV